MLKIWLIRLKSSLLLAPTLLFLGFAPIETFGAPRCNIRTIVTRTNESTTPAPIYLSKISELDGLRLKAATIKKISEIFDKKGWELSTKNIREVIEGAAEMIMGNQNKPSIEKSDRMAKIGREILSAVKAELSDSEYRAVNFLVAEAVLRLESIKSSEFSSAEAPKVFKKKYTFHISDFHKMVEAYIDGNRRYTGLTSDTDGVLDWDVIRTLYANNSWVLSERDHDTFHLHYSYGHPYYLAINLATSRSINDRRYTMTSALWEAVDTFRTGYEGQIANYFKSKRMTAEEAMLFLGSATEKELDEVQQRTADPRNTSYFNNYSYENGWRPVKTKFGRTSAFNEKTLWKELTDYINASLKYINSPTKRKYVNYHRRGPGESVQRSEETIP